MFKFIKEWYKDYNAAQEELSKMGIFNITTPWGSYYNSCVNTEHDKQESIRENNTDSKSRRRV